MTEPMNYVTRLTLIGRVEVTLMNTQLISLK